MGALNPRFVVTVGDNVYNSGGESEYGDLAPAPGGTGNLFPAQYWPQLGGGVPAFFSQGNHGFTNSAPLFSNIPQDSTVAACAGCTYGPVTYPAINNPPVTDAGGTYGTDYYAFSYGNARFYVLHSAWTDSDTSATCPPLPSGQTDPSGGPYCADYVQHWQTTSPEYAWLKADMESHPSSLKFAFFHYPLWADGGAQSSDPYTNSQGPAGSASLESLLASHSVDIAFNGHDHAYQRNFPMVAGTQMVSYVSGAGGSTLLAGTSCNSPGCAFAAQTWSFLSVQVQGNTVTVTPTDENGAGFDQQSYSFTPPPGSIKGTVTDASTNSAISGASITCTCGGSATSAADGSYTISSVPPGTYSVTASATNHTAQTITNVSVTTGTATTENFALVLAPGSITGKVTDSSTAGAISGASITCSCGGSATSATDGSYTISSVPPGTYSVTASATNYTTQTISNVSVTTGTATTENFALVAAAGSITGKVTDASTAGAISGASITCSCGGSATSATDGSYTLSSVIAGSYSVTAAAAGHVTKTVSPVTVTAGQPTTQNFALVATGSITGTITNSGTSAAISGASVSDGVDPAVLTNSSGVYSITGVAPGSYTLTASASGYVSQTAPVTVTAGAQTTQNLALAPTPPGAIAGTVSDATSAHNPISGAALSCSCGSTATSNSSGAYSMPSVPTGSYSVTVTASGYSSQTVTVTVTSGQTTTQNFTLSLTPGSITGTITASGSNAAISGASVTDGVDPAVLTNASGVYTIANVAPATYTVTASASGYVTQSATSVVVSAGQQTTQNLVLAVAPGSLSGTVTDNTTHTAISGASVACACGNVSTNASGVYSYPSLAPGNYTLTVSASGYVSQTAVVSVTAGQTTTQNFALLVTPGGITGTVTASGSNAAISGASVSDGVDPAVTTNASGVYTIANVAPGSYTVTATPTGYVQGSAAATVTSGQTTQNVNFALAAAPTGPKFVQSASSSSTTVSFATPTTAGDLLVLTAGLYTGTTQPISAVSDGKNTWTRIGAFATASHYSDGELWYAANAQPVTSITVSTGASSVVLQVMEFSGVAASSPVDVSAGASNSNTAPSSGSVTPSATKDLVVGFIAGHSSAQAITVTSPGYSILPQQATSLVSLVSGYQMLGAASAQSFTGSLATSMWWAAGVVCFRSAS